ncbi:ATP-binding protein [Pseudobacteriovorax antillogorgiicola]|uniref:histidine kinase n=1 Tax=Pseudobacteriovorax antillogorgiicola TaxID=1513793 RepID=A0A1Y6CKW3_9BACT|nr:ATP-binding protein [Pseudobacteriovorax antillogorgiicola]TCS47681.1 Hpt domain-containing protein [Pseudobacteriovorax antillogorgiicola]SMF59584.1 Hpt domain-containing protein [Pseudobacteriovorax antillogorgiicola]
MAQGFANTWRTRWLAFVDAFIPESISGDSVRKRRGRFVVMSSFTIGLLMSAIATLVGFRVGFDSWNFWVSALAAGILFCVPLILRLTRSLTFSSCVISGFGLFVVPLPILSGASFMENHLLWLVLITLGSTWFLGFRLGFVTMILALAEVWVLYFTLGIHEAASASVESHFILRKCVIISVMVVTTWILTYLNDKANTASQEELEQKIQDKERFKVLFTHSQDPHFLISKLGLIEFNDAASRMLRCTQGGRMAKLLHQVSMGSGDGPVRNPIEHYEQIFTEIKVKGFISQEGRVQVGEQTIPLQILMSLAELHGEPVLLMNWHDLTEVKKVEQRLIQAEREALRAADTKSAFLANMSHEIRTPLNGIIGFSEILMESELDRKQKDAVKGMQICGETLITLINDILDFSRLEAGNLDLTKHSFDFHNTLETCFSMFFQEASLKGIDLDIDIGSGVPQFVKSDENRLRQVVVNLLSNAVKFTERGSVQLYAELMNHEEGHSRVRIHVKDSGIGIGEADQKHLFKSFSQVDASSTRRFQGTGLGLAICRGVLEAMGGSIWVKSAIGQGAHFTFELDLEHGHHVVQGEAHFEVSLPDNLRILVVDDNDLNIKVAIHHLDGLEADIQVARNGQEALDMASRERYDICFMDCQMPVMDGYTATREIIQTVSEDQRPYIIAMTANAMAGDREACIAAGMNDYIAKPVKKITMFKAIEKGVHRSGEGSNNVHHLKDYDEASDSTLRILEDRFDGDINFYCEMIDQYESSSREQMAELKRAIEASQIDRELSLCHSMKGMSLNMGFDSIAEMFLQAELLLRHDKGQLNLERWRFFLDRIDEDISQSRAHLASKKAS